MPMTGMGTRNRDAAGALISSAAVWMDIATEAIAAVAATTVRIDGAREGAKEQMKMAMTAKTKY